MDVLGIVAPHPPIVVEAVGGPRAHVTDATRDALAAAAAVLEDWAPDTLVLMSPHAPVARSAFAIDDSVSCSGDLDGFGAPGVRIEMTGDPGLARAIAREADAVGVPTVLRSSTPLLEPGILDHGALVPLSFLDPGGRLRIVELSLSFLPLDVHATFGRAVQHAAQATGRRVAFVASGDCSHRLTHDAPAGFSPRGAEFDAALVAAMREGDLLDLAVLDRSLIEAAGECGLRSFITLGGFLEGASVVPRVLAYEGPWGVGYLTAVFGPREPVDDVLSAVAKTQGAQSPPSAGSPRAASTEPVPTSAPSPPVALARRAIEAYVRERRVIPPPPPEGVFAHPRGAFVSLHRHGMLRGCIGTTGPTEDSLAAEIVHNAIQAATADPRFPPLEPDELDDLEISVDVLDAPEPATREDLDPGTYGVIVSADWRRGLLLPDLEGVDTVEEQVAIAMRKAGIRPDERVRLERFRVTRYH